MANPKFWYYPTPSGSHLVEIDLGEPLEELFTEFQVDSATAVGFDGSMYRTTGVHREVVSIQRGRFKLGEDLAVKLQAMQNHLDRGFSVAFSNDPDKAYCFPLMGIAQGGTFQMNLQTDPFRGFTGGAVPSEKDFVTIESQNPALIYEQHKVAANSVSTPAASITSALGGTLNFSTNDPLCFSHSIGFLRHYRFYPILKRPQTEVGRNIVTSEGGRLFSLNINLVVDYQTLFSHHPDVGRYESIDPEWGSGVGIWDGIEVYPVIPDGDTTNLDRVTYTKEYIDPYRDMYPDKPTGDLEKPK